MPDMNQRLTATCAAILVFLAGTRIPISGIDPSLAKAASRTLPGGFGIGRLSIMGPGVTPWLNALILAEIARLAVPPLRRWSEAQENARCWTRIVLAATALMALIQAYGMAAAISSSPPSDLYSQAPNFPQTLVTLMTGSMVAIWLAHLITTNGIGSGLWVLLLTPTLLLLPQQAATLLELTNHNEISGPSIAMAFAALVLSTAIVVRLLSRSGPEGPATAEDFIWPVILGGAVAEWLLVSAGLLMRDPAIFMGIKPDAPVLLALAAASTFGFALIYMARTQGKEGVLLSAATIAVAALLPRLASAFAGAPLLVDGRMMVILVAVLHFVLRPRTAIVPA